jgi:cobalamin synthase
VITLLPVIGLVQVGSQAMADRYTYLPLIGLFMILAWGLAELTARPSHGIPLVPVAAGTLILVCVFTARAQVEY